MWRLPQAICSSSWITSTRSNSHRRKGIAQISFSVKISHCWIRTLCYLNNIVWPQWLISEQYKAIWMRNMPPMLYQKRPSDFASKNSFNWNVLLHSLQFQNDAKWFSQTSFQKTCWYYWSECLYRILYSTNWHKRQ